MRGSFLMMCGAACLAMRSQGRQLYRSQRVDAAVDSVNYLFETGNDPIMAIVAQSPDLEQRIDAVRRFNRFYTRRIGVLQDGYLHSDFSLAEVRVLYELAQRGRCTARELGQDLDIDAGYLSRIVHGFIRRGLLDRTKADHDGRASWLRLTVAGRAAFEPLQESARAQVGALLGALPETAQVQ